MGNTNETKSKGNLGCAIIACILSLVGLSIAVDNDEIVTGFGVIPITIIGLVFVYFVTKSIYNLDNNDVNKDQNEKATNVNSNLNSTTKPINKYYIDPEKVRENRLKLSVTEPKFSNAYIMELNEVVVYHMTSIYDPLLPYALKIPNDKENIVNLIKECKIVKIPEALFYRWIVKKMIVQEKIDGILTNNWKINPEYVNSNINATTKGS